MDKRKQLAIMVFCRSFLFYNQMLTEREADRVFDRIRAFQDRYKIDITREQIDSVEIIIHDNPELLKGGENDIHDSVFRPRKGQ